MAIKDKPIEIDSAKGAADVKWPDKQLEERFRAYWINRFTGSVEDGYKMENPYVQQMVSPKLYRDYVQNAKKNRLEKIEIRRIRWASEYEVEIDCLLTLQTSAKENVQSSLVDRWIYLDGKWLHVIRDPLLSL